MLYATIADTLRDLGTLCAALAAIAALVALIFRLPPVRWVWRHLVTDPFAAWLRSEVRSVVESRNGGSTLMDKVETTTAFAETLDRRLKSIESALGVTGENDG
jgi:hypothetical protein